MKKLYCTLIPLIFAFISIGQNTTQKPCPCCTEEFRQFDFWVGNWEVTAKGKIVGHNLIEIIQDSCIVRENWSAASSPYTGTSYNNYDRNTNTWSQLWIDNSGSVLRLNGSLNDGAMVLLSDPAIDKDGKINMNRIIWTPQPDGDVRQHWEVTSDGGQIWTTAFDGMYKRKK